MNALSPARRVDPLVSARLSLQHLNLDFDQLFVWPSPTQRPAVAQTRRQYPRRPCLRARRQGQTLEAIQRQPTAGRRPSGQRKLSLSPVARRGRGPQGATLPSPTATGRARPRWPAGARRGRRATTGPDHRSAVHHPGRGLVSVRVPQLLALDLPRTRCVRAGLPGSEGHSAPARLFWPCCCRNCWATAASVTSAICAPMKGRDFRAGLNVLPKTTYATDYSYRAPTCTMHERLHRGPDRQNTPRSAPHTFNLDFHAIPFRGHEPDLEKHWVPLRNRALPAVMAFVAPGRRAADHVLRHGQRAARGCGRHGPAVRPLLERADRTVSGRACCSIRGPPPMRA